jgi:hypothetical protein
MKEQERQAHSERGKRDEEVDRWQEYLLDDVLICDLLLEFLIGLKLLVEPRVGPLHCTVQTSVTQRPTGQNSVVSTTHEEECCQLEETCTNAAAVPIPDEMEEAAGDVDQ